MTLTLVTVNYNGSADTLSLLSSLSRQSDTSFDVIVVDNDSSDADREALGAGAASSQLAVDVVYTGRNLGFSGGNNVGIRKALAQGAEWVVLINNDTTVGTDFIAQLRTSLPVQAAVVGIPLNEGSRTVTAGVLEWLRPTLTHAGTASGGTQTYAIGAGVAVHRDVIERIGFLDEGYFLYFEDAEYSARARSAGIPVEFLSAPTIQHRVSSTTKSLGAPLLLHYHFRNMVRLNRQHAPLWARLALPFVLVWHTVKQIVKLIIGRARPQSAAILAGIRDGILDRSGTLTRRRVIAVECESLEDESWGVARQVRGFLTALLDIPEVRRSYDVVAYFKTRVPDEEWTRLPNVRTVVVRPFRWLPASFSLYFYVFLPIRVWFDRPTVTVIANYMLPLIWVGRTIVMLTEDVWHEMYGNALPFKYRLAYRIFATHAARRATRIMAISRASAQRVAQLFNIELTRIAVNELAVPEPRTVAPREGEYVLYVGQGLPRRHLRETILAFTRLAPSDPNLALIAVGPDKYQPPVIGRLVEKTNSILGRTAITWTQRVTDVELAALYAGARALIYVSDMEAFGLPPVEALSYGVPSVVLDAPVHREIFGEHAFYTPSGSVEDITAAMLQSLTDTGHRKRIVHASESIVSRYTWRAHAERMLRIISDIA